MAKRRPRQAKAPYKKFIGKGESQETAAGADTGSGKLVFLGGARKGRASSAPLFLTGESVLPLELLDIIVSYCESPLQLLSVSRMWFLAAIPYVYNSPTLTARNFAGFAETVTAHKMLGSYVETLDLSGIVQTGKNSVIARLLRRCGSKLGSFVAPQCHFGYSPMLALRGCLRLRVLDLGFVSETVDLPQLLASVETFEELEVLSFPRSSILCDRYDLRWPPNLRSLGLAGGISASLLENCELPSSITRLRLSNCPYVTTSALTAALAKVGPQLRHLAIEYPMPLVDENGLDSLLVLCPNLKSLEVSVDYVTRRLLDPHVVSYHPLRTLTLLSSGMLGHADKLHPAAVLLATENLLDLQHVRINDGLVSSPAWNRTITEEVADLSHILRSRSGELWVVPRGWLR